MFPIHQHFVLPKVDDAYLDQGVGVSVITDEQDPLGREWRAVLLSAVMEAGAPAGRATW